MVTALPASSHPVSRNLAAFAILAKRFLYRGIFFQNEDEHAIKPAEILPRFDKSETVSRENVGDFRLLCVADLDGNKTIFLEVLLRALRDGPVGIKPICSAIERCLRIVVPDLALQGLKLIGPYVGRICDNSMEGAGNFFEPVRQNGVKPFRKPVFQGVARGGGQRVSGNIGAHRPRPGHLRKQGKRDRSGTRAKIQNAQRAFQGGEWSKSLKRRIDQYFGIGTRLQRFRRKEELEPIEFAKADDPVDRFSSDPASYRLAYAGNRFGTHRQFGPADRIGSGRSGKMLDQKTRIEIRIVDPA